MTELYDAVNYQNIPANAQYVAGYVNGPVSQWPPEGWVRYPNALRIDVNGGRPDADVLDVERYDATPQTAPIWLRRHNVAGRRIGMLYCNLSTRSQVEQACAGLPYLLWLADPTGTLHLVPGSALTQSIWTQNYDVSLCEDGWPENWETIGGNVSVLNKPVVAIVPTSSGGGYWLVAGDGGIFAFGNALAFADPLPGKEITEPIVNAAGTPSGRGLWLVGADGGVFTFGDAPFKGSIPGLGIGPSPSPVI